jgi:hypothetical protein
MLSLRDAGHGRDFVVFSLVPDLLLVVFVAGAGGWYQMPCGSY